nr:hypothetical protein [Tanacetum cinerariifolium]
AKGAGLRWGGVGKVMGSSGSGGEWLGEWGEAAISLAGNRDGTVSVQTWGR